MLVYFECLDDFAKRVVNENFVQNLDQEEYFAGPSKQPRCPCFNHISKDACLQGIYKLHVTYSIEINLMLKIDREDFYGIVDDGRTFYLNPC